MAAQTQLQIGDKIPDFSLQDQHGKTITSQSLLGKGALVIYFYPKDDTPGCTKEACSFRDNFEAFTDINATVVGISADNVQSHKKFAKKYNLPFTLLSDNNNDVRKQFGVKGDFFGLIPGRVTFVANAKGEIIYVFSSQSKATEHITKSLEAISKSK